MSTPPKSSVAGEAASTDWASDGAAPNSAPATVSVQTNNAGRTRRRAHKDRDRLPVTWSGADASKSLTEGTAPYGIYSALKLLDRICKRLHPEPRLAAPYRDIAVIRQRTDDRTR